MTTKSKPVRIFVDDDRSLDHLTRLLRRSRAQVVHEALAEYLANHRDELVRLADQSQRAIAASDLVSLAEVSSRARDAEADAILAEAQRRPITRATVQRLGERRARTMQGQVFVDDSTDLLRAAREERDRQLTGQ